MCSCPDSTVGSMRRAWRQLISQTWLVENNWVAPLIALIPKVLCHIRRQGASVTLVAPVWPGCWWFQDLQEMAVDVCDLATMAEMFVPVPWSMLEPLCNCHWRWAAWWISGLTTHVDGLVAPSAP